MSLNPADPRPLYHQLAAELRAQIYAGDLAPGAQMPTEAELCTRYDTARNTVRLALALLRTEGLITSQRGRGSFVRGDSPVRFYATLSGSRKKRLEANKRHDTFSQQIRALGRTAKQVSTVEIVQADDRTGPKLAIDPGASIAVRRRVMYADGEPLQLGDSYYPLDIVQDSKLMGTADITEGSDQVLEDLGHTPTRYEDEITWRMPTAAEATALHLGNGIPVGQVERLSYDQNDQPIELYVMTLPADRHVLLYEVDAE